MQVAPYEVTPLVTIPNGSPCLDATLIPSRRASGQDTLKTTRGLARGGLIASKNKIHSTVEVEADGFEGYVLVELLL